MVVGVPEMILLVLLVLIPVCSIWNWADLWGQYHDGQPLVPVTQGDTVPWGLIDLGAMVLFLGVIVDLGVVGIRNWAGIEPAAELDQLSPRDQSIVFAAFGTTSLVATLCCFAWVHLRLRATPTQLGLSRERFGEDVKLGIRWFTMLIVPMLLLQLLLTRWIPTQHPLTEMLQRSGSTSLLPVAAYAAIVTAPIFEESLFRLFLQGWLEKLQITIWRNRLGLASKHDRDAVLVGGATSDQLEQPSGHASISETLAAEDLDAEKTEAQSRSRSRETSGRHPKRENSHESGDKNLSRHCGTGQETVRAQGGDRSIIWMPILVSSGLFSLLHMSHGPDWLPLFFLALGLGYLYQRTRRIQACIVVHVLVNALGILQLWSAMRQPT